MVRNEDALRNNEFLPGIVAQACNPSTWDADTREHQV